MRPRIPTPYGACRFSSLFSVKAFFHSILRRSFLTPSLALTAKLRLTTLQTTNFKLISHHHITFLPTTAKLTMCKYWKKMHTCGHPSDRPYIEMCRSGCLSNTVCTDIGLDETTRSSHFPCYPCIRGEARDEAEALIRGQQEAVFKAHEARDRALKEKAAAEQRAKEERIRRDAREKAAREREEDARMKATKEREEERTKKEGGAWTETGSGKKQKSRKGAPADGFPIMPISAPPALKTFAAKDKKENENGTKMSPKREGKGVDTGGRAGTWGPKKILSRKENASVQK
ncbi:hypothetical protein CC86DRAFT_184851 [Ophiobolus disseminans]|uniref:Uncharacterized protein n=1 Tax=Ophiobolus disseminans TaxID=1469910 RepID=A0A6A7A7F6_9PLEO|nr:hypothetical protein CC86DRAFT_184851 [Ophiobolus disseminans]